MYIHKLQTYLAYFTIVASFMCLLTFLVLWLYPWKGIDVYNQPYELHDRVVAQGEFVKYDISYCRYTNVDSLVLHQLVDTGNAQFRITGNYTITASEQSDGLRLQEGCGDITKAVFIPPYVQPGIYRLEENVSYKVNPFHTTSYIFTTEPFEVVE